MKITVRGQTIESFRIFVEDENSVKEYDIAALLVVDDASLEQETRDAAANEHFWNQIALEAEKDLEEFEKTWYTVYCAHVEKFARYFLKAQGDKNPTGTAKEKAASLLFSGDAEADQITHAFVAYQAYTEEMGKIGVKPVTEAEFKEEMYHYSQTMEEIERIRIAMAHKARQLKAVSAAFNTKSWSIKTLAADRRAMIGSGV
jgi:hypothetical protein